MERTIRVFIADSSRDGACLLRDALAQEEGLIVVNTVWRGDDALRLFPDSGADVLLCDLMLAGTDGLSLLRRLRDRGQLPHAIVLSAFFNDRAAYQVSAVADMFLSKPCALADLACHIRACASGQPRGDSRFGRDAIYQALINAGGMPHLGGFQYLRSALERTLADPALLQGVTKSLYRDVAREYGTTPACVERSIRMAIDSLKPSFMTPSRQDTSKAAWRVAYLPTIARACSALTFGSLAWYDMLYSSIIS